MHQLLLKTNLRRSNPQHHSSELDSHQYANHHLTQDKNRNIPTTPAQERYPNHIYEYQSETPAFYSKLKDLGSDIEAAEGSLEHAASASQNEKSSQIEYISQMNSQQLHPMILSQINNPRPGLNKLIYLKLRNAVSEMKHVHFELAEYLQDQKILMEGFRQKLSQNLQAFLKEYHKKANKESQQAECQLLKNENNILRQRMERREAEYQRMSRELQSARSSTLQRKKTLQSNVHQQTQQHECTQCKNMNSKLLSVEQQLQKSQEEVERLLVQNEQLQEHIFDIEQKIAGVDLEVERKLKEQMHLFAAYRQSPNNNKANQQLQLEVEELQHKCQQMEHTLNQHADIDQKLQQLYLKEKELQQLQVALREAQCKADQVRQANYERQHQILQAEQNLSKKINELRSKEGELSRWEADLTRKFRVNTQQQAHLEETNQLKVSREISLKSFGKAPPDIMAQDQFEPRMPPRLKTHQNQMEHIGTYKPQHLHHREYQQSSFEKRTLDRKYYPEHDHRSREHMNTFNKKVNMTLSNYREQREPSPYRNLPEHRSRIMQNGHNASEYRELSKNSRHSATKSMKNIFPVSASPATKMRGEGAPLSGLGSKLQKLREQIKKEIQSIK